jgi:flagellar FliL protein
MATKTEAKAPKEAPAPQEKSVAPAEAPAAGSQPKSSALKAWLPAIVAILVAPAGSFAISQFVLLPRMQQKLAAPAVERSAADNASAPAAEDGGKKDPKDEKGGGAAGSNYEFNNVVVNLAGTMGTRYLKTSFVVTAADKSGNVKAVFEGQKAKLTDITLNVLSSLTLADLEEPGAKNVLREKLVAAYNQALDKRVVDQVYFSDFVIQ